jgi:hypothetical protein
MHPRAHGALTLVLTLLPAAHGAAATPRDRYIVDQAADTVTDTRTGLVWQRSDPGTLYTWEGATARCAGLGLRLPTRKELLTLVDPTHSSPSIDVSAFADASADIFWSSSTKVGTVGSAWYVSFYNGFSSSNPTNYRYRARCVR